MKSMNIWIWPLVVLLLAAHLSVAFADIPITVIETKREREERIRFEKAREERARHPVVTLNVAVQPKDDEVSLRFNLPGPGEYEGQLTSCRRTPPDAGCNEIAAIRGVNDRLGNAWLEEKVSRRGLERGENTLDVVFTLRRVVKTGFGPKVTDEIRRVRQIWHISVVGRDRSGNVQLEAKLFDVVEEGQESKP